MKPKVVYPKSMECDCGSASCYQIARRRKYRRLFLKGFYSAGKDLRRVEKQRADQKGGRMSTFAATLKKFVKKFETKKAAAQCLGVTRATLYRWLNGKPVRVKNAARVLNVIGRRAR